MFTTLLLTIAVMAQPGSQPPALIWQDAPPNHDPSTIYLVRPQWCHGTYCDPPRIIGGYNYTQEKYRPYDASKREWQKVSDVPSDAPPVPKRGKNKLPTGVRNDQIHPSPFILSGVPMAEEEAGAILNDDSTLPFLTIIAPKDQWRVILDQLPPDLKAGSRLKCVDPSNFAVKKFNVKAGNTCVVYQKPDGKRIARSEPFALADFMKQVGGKPVKPDDTTPTAPFGFSVLEITIAGSLLLFLILRNR